MAITTTTDREIRTENLLELLTELWDQGSLEADDYTDLTAIVEIARDKTSVRSYSAALNASRYDF